MLSEGAVSLSRCPSSDINKIMRSIGRSHLGRMPPYGVDRGSQMPLKVLLIFVILGWQGQAHAQSCRDIFNQIKKEAMYCGFYCDQEILEPLEQVYEEKCIGLIIPLSSFESLPSPPQASVLGSHNHKNPETTAPGDDTLRVDSSSTYYDAPEQIGSVVTSSSSVESMRSRVK